MNRGHLYQMGNQGDVEVTRTGPDRRDCFRIRLIQFERLNLDLY